MPKRRDKEFLLDIMEAIKRIDLYTKELSYQDFIQRIETQDAVVRNFEIIGEAVKNTSKKLKTKYYGWKGLHPWDTDHGFVNCQSRCEWDDN